MKSWIKITLCAYFGFSILSAAQAAVYFVDANPLRGSDDPAGGDFFAPWQSLQYAIDHASDGDTILVEDGTYVLGGTLQIHKEIILSGLNGAFFIDASGVGNTYGIHIEASNVELHDIHVIPPTVPGSVGTSDGGGYAIHATFDHDLPYTPHTNLTLMNISISNGNRTPFDIHGYDGVQLSGLVANDAAYGNGIQLTGCTDVTIVNCSATGNAWGGLAFYASKSTYLNRACSSISYDMAANTIDNVYIEDEFGLVNDVIVSGASHQIDNLYAADAAMHFYIMGDENEAALVAGALNTKYGNTSSTVQDLVTNTLIVSSGLDLAAAVAAANPGSTVVVSNGTYILSSALQINKPLTLLGESEAGVIIDASGNGTGRGIEVRADHVSLQNFTLLPPIVPGSVGTSSGGGFPIFATFNQSTDPDEMYTNLSLANILIENSNRTGFDIHGYDGVVLSNLTTTGASYGNGIQLTGCFDVSIVDCVASNNAWGNLAFYYSSYLNQGSSNIVYNMADNDIDFVYSQAGAGPNYVAITGADYVIDYGPGFEMHTTSDETVAVDIAEGLVARYGMPIAVVNEAATGNLIVTPSSSIQASIDSAAPGATVVVKDGTYNENVDIDKSITLISENGKGAVTIQGSDNQGPLGTVQVSSSDVSIGTDTDNGFTIIGYDHNTAGLEHSGVYLKGSVSNIVVYGNEIIANGESALMAEYGPTCDNIEIAFNIFGGQTYTNDMVGGNSSVQFTTMNVPRSMIYFGGGGAKTGLYFHDNYIGGSVGGEIDTAPGTYYYNTGVTLDGIGATDIASGAVISNNTFEVGSWAALRARGPYSTVQNNTFLNTSEGMAGVYVANVENDVYAGNSFEVGPGLAGGYVAVLPGSTVLVDGNEAAYDYTLTAGGQIVVTWGENSMTLIGSTGSIQFTDGSSDIASILATAPTYFYVPDDYPQLQDAIAVAEDCDKIFVAAGTYSATSTINIDKELTIVGEGSDVVTLDLSGFTGAGYGLLIEADNVTLEGMTIIPSTVAAGNSYTVKAQFITSTKTMINDLILRDLVVNGSYKTAFDLHGVNGAVLENLAVSNTVSGNGISLTGCIDVEVEACVTDANAWGGIALYASNGSYLDQASSDILISDTCVLGEVQPVYVQMGVYTSSNLSIPGGTYQVFAFNDAYYVTDRTRAFNIATYYEVNYGAETLVNAPDGTESPAGGDVLVDTSFDTSTDGFGYYSFDNLSDGIDNVYTGGVVNVASGTYEGQFEITKPMTISGAGTGATIIKPVANMTLGWAGSPDEPTVYVHDTDGVNFVNLSFEGDGLGTGSGNYRLSGVGYRNAGGMVSNCTFNAFRDTPMKGNQHGYGIRGLNDDGTDRMVAVYDSSFTDIQKNALDLRGANMLVDIRGNTMTGAGFTETIAQNGIVLVYGASGIIEGNTITGYNYNKADDATESTGVLLYAAGSGTVISNNILDAEVAAYVYDTDDAVIVDNTIENLLGFTGLAIAIEDSSNVVASVSGNIDGYPRWLAADGTLNIDPAAVGLRIANSSGLVGFADESKTVDELIAATSSHLYVPADYAQLQDAVAVAVDGDTIFVAAGSYDSDSTIHIDKELTIIGEGSGDVTLDLAGCGNSWGLWITADNVTVEGMRLVAPGDASSGGYAIHASPDEPVTTDSSPVQNLVLRDIVVDSAYRTPFDIHGVDGAVLENLIASNTESGNGIQLTGCANVAITGCTTVGNAWGGVAFYVSAGMQLACSNITFDYAQNSIGETVYIQNGSGLESSVTVLGAAYRVENTSFTIFTDQNETVAAAIAAGLNSRFSNVLSTISSETESLHLVVDGMSIQAAIDAANTGDTIQVGAGTYTESVNVNKPVTLLGANAGIDGVVGSRGSESVLLGQMEITSDLVTVDGMKISNPSGTLGIYAKTVGDLTIVNNVICDVNTNSVGSASAIYVKAVGEDVSGYTITGNNIFGIGSSNATVSTKGIYFGDSNGENVMSDILIQSNRVADVSVNAADYASGGRGAYGILINYGVYSSGYVTNVLILDNIISDLEGYWVHGVGLETDTQATVVQGNMFDTITSTYPTAVFFEDNPSADTVELSYNAFDASVGIGVAIHPDDVGVISVNAESNFWGSVDPDFNVLAGSGVSFDPWYADVLFTTHRSLNIFVDDDFNPTTPDWGITSFADLQSALVGAGAGATIHLAAGTYAETGQVVIDKNLTIVGEDRVSTIFNPTADTASSGDPRGWFLVESGVEFNLSNVTLDGSGYLVYQGIRHKGSGTITDVDFTEIKFNESGPTYGGVAVAAFGGVVDFNGCTFSEIGRVGVLYFGSGVSVSTFAGNTYTGKGPGDWLDYCLDIGAGANVVVSNNIITDCYGVASSDGSTSAGILATTFYGAGTGAEIIGNTISQNSQGIAVGYDATDSSVVNAEFNDLSGNDVAVAAQDNVIVDATYNYFGSEDPEFDTLVDGPAVFDPWFMDSGMTQLYSANVYVDAGFDASTSGWGVTHFATINSALPFASNGGEMHIAAGTYAEDVSITRPLVIMGPNAGINAVTGSRNPEAVIQGGITVLGDGVTIDGLTINNPLSTIGLYAKTVNNLSVENNIIADVNTVGAGSACAVYVKATGEDTSGFSITGNDIFNIGSANASVSTKGIYFGDSNGENVMSDVLIQSNRIAAVSVNAADYASGGRGAYGILLNYGVYSTGYMENVQVLDNIVTGLEGYWVHGIGLETDTRSCVVQGNEIDGLNSGLAAAVFFEGNPSGGTVALTENTFGANVGVAVAIHDSDAGNYTVDATRNYFSTQLPDFAQLLYGDVDADPWYIDASMTQLNATEVYVDDDFSETTPGWGVTAFTNIQKAITGTAINGTLYVAAGTYAEQLVVDKPMTLIGPNAGISPNGGVRGAEAVLMPPVSDISSASLISVVASGVTVDGFTLDGDNPLLTSGFIGAGGADMDAAEGIVVYENNVSNLVVSCNVMQNLSYFGVNIFGGQPWYSAPSTSGHLISDNLIRNLGTYDSASGIAKWGGGVLLYNDQYARIESNVMQNVRLGIQTGNFHDPNPGSADYQVIVGNTIECRRMGIFHNLFTGSPDAYTMQDNTIIGLSDPNEPTVKGILLASQGIDSHAIDNVIDMTGVASNSIGYEVWNVDAAAPAQISGGSLLGAGIGVFVNNYDGYTSDASRGGHATISDLVIEPNSTGTGVYILDNTNSTHNAVVAVLADVTVNGGAIGLAIDGDAADVILSGVAPLALNGTTDYIVLNDYSSDIDATAIQFDGLTGADMTEPEQIAVEAKMYHHPDDNELGLITWIEDKYFGDNLIVDDRVIGPGEVVQVFGGAQLGDGVNPTVWTVDNGTLEIDSDFTLAQGAELIVRDGTLVLNTVDGTTTIAGTFTIFDSWGSFYINGDTELAGDTFALVSHLAFADGVTLTVSGNALFDGCVLDAQNDGEMYNLSVSNTASFKMVRCEVYDYSSYFVDSGDAVLKDNYLQNGVIVGALADGAAIYHNVMDDLADLIDGGLNTVTELDGWGNVATAENTLNNLGINLVGSDSNGDLFIQPGETVQVSVDVDSLNVPVQGAEALFGYNTRFLGDVETVVLTAGGGHWANVLDTGVNLDAATFGQVDAQIGVAFPPVAPAEGSSDDATVLSLDFTSTLEEGVTKVFFRTEKTGYLPEETRFAVKTNSSPAYYISPFTLNSGYITIDGTEPVSSNFFGFQTQDGVDVDSFDVLTLTEQGTVLVSIDAEDDASGLAGASLTATHQDDASVTLPVTLITSHVAGEMMATYNWAINVDAAASNGVYDVEVVVADRSGNTVTNGATIEVNKTALNAEVTLLGVASTVDRDVLFVLTDELGAVIESRIETVNFISGTGVASLTQIPVGTVAISADTDWTLRAKHLIAYDVDGQASVSFDLIGGDLNNDNIIDMLDYARLRYFYGVDLLLEPTAEVADINADGVVGQLDYIDMRFNWYQQGDAE